MTQIASDKIIPRTINLDTFSKGAVSDALQYSDNIKFKKSGKDIKEALAKVKIKDEAMKTELSTKMTVLCAGLPIQPSQEASSYRYGGFGDKIGCVMMYPYNLTYGESKSDSPMITSVVNAEEQPVDNSKNYGQYNDLASSYIDVCIELCVIESFSNNIDDKTQYELNQRQLTALGF